MPKERTDRTPSDEEILSYDNVPILIAAAYLGCGPEQLRRALRQGRAPFGYAVQNEEKDSWTFQISPGLLVKYKSGELSVWPFNQLLQQIEERVDKLIDLRSKAAMEVLCPGLAAKSK